MKRARFRDPAGSVRIGEWVDGTITAAGREYDADDVDVLAPTVPGKVLGIGPNYRSNVEEPPERQRLFWKGGANVAAGHGDTVTLPESSEVVFEAELGVVVGEQCRNLGIEDAMDAVAGFTCVDDLSNQDAVGEDTFLRRKSFDNAAPMGPVLADPEDVPEEPRVRLWVNGEKRQDSRDDAFLFSVEEVVAEVTRFVTLEPGDVVAMGTPTGYGALADGDSVAIEVEGVGRLEHDVVAPGGPGR